MSGKTNGSYIRQPAFTVPVTPSDAADLPHGVARGLWVGGSGDVKVTYENGITDILPSVIAGVSHGMFIRRIWATDTTATDIHAAY